MDQHSFYDYWMAVYRRKRAVLLLVGTSIVTAVLFSAMLTPVYEARGVFYIPTAAGDKSGSSGAVSPTSQDEAKTYVGILKGRDAARRIHEWFPAKTVERLEKDVDFSAGREGLIRVYVRDHDSQLAADIANSYVRFFNEFSSASVIRDLTRERKFMEQQIQDTAAKLDEVRQQRKKFQETNHVPAVQSQLDALLKQRQEFLHDMETARADLASTRQRIQSTQDELKREGQNFGPSEMAASNKVIETLQERLADLEIQLAGKKVDMKDAHPEVLGLERQYRQAKANLEREIQRVVQSRTKDPTTLHEKLRQNLVNLYVEQQSQEAHVRSLENVLAKLDAQVTAMPSITFDADTLQSTTQLYSDLLASLLKKLEDHKSREVKNHDIATIVETAFPPISPAYPIPVLNIVLALILGLIAGVIYALFLEYLEATRRAIRLREMELEELVYESGPTTVA